MKYNYFITINSFNPKNVIGWPQIAKSCLQNKSFKILFDSTNNYHNKIKSDLTRNGIDEIDFIDSTNISFIENDIIVNLDESNSTNIPININCKIITALCGYKPTCLQEQLSFIQKIKPFKVYTEILEDEFFNITSSFIPSDILNIMYFLPPFIKVDCLSNSLEIIYDKETDIKDDILLKFISLSSDKRIIQTSIKDSSFKSIEKKILLNYANYPQLSHISNIVLNRYNHFFYNCFISPLRISFSKISGDNCFININDKTSLREKFNQYSKLLKEFDTSDKKHVISELDFSFSFDTHYFFQFKSEFKLISKSIENTKYFKNIFILKCLYDNLSYIDNVNFCFFSLIMHQYDFKTSATTTRIFSRILKLNHTCLFSYLVTIKLQLISENKDIIYGIYHSIITDKNKDILIIRDFISTLNKINFKEYNYLILKLLLFSEEIDFFKDQILQLFKSNSFCIKTAYHSSLHELFHPIHSKISNLFIKSIFNKISINNLSTDELLIYSRFSIINNDFNVGLNVINNMLVNKKISQYNQLHFIIFSYVYSSYNKLIFNQVNFEIPTYTKNEVLNLLTFSLISNDTVNFNILLKKLTTDFDSIFAFENLTLVKMLPFILIGVYSDSNVILSKIINILNNCSIDVLKIEDFSIFKNNKSNNFKVDINIILKFLDPL